MENLRTDQNLNKSKEGRKKGRVGGRKKGGKKVKTTMIVRSMGFALDSSNYLHAIPYHTF